MIMDIHDERVSSYYIYTYCFLYIKGDFLVKLRIKCSILIVLVLHRNITMYIFDRIMDLIIPDKWGVYYSYTTIFFQK